MTRSCKITLLAAVVAALLSIPLAETFARGRGGGGGRGGGMRGGGMSRPSPSINRNPGFSAPRPTQRPSTRPSTPSRPSAGARPSTRPSTPSVGSRPGTSPGSRPGVVEFPKPGGSSRPSIADRPTTRPGTGTRPGIGDRPTTRPGIGDRPSTLPGTGTRPGISDRPGIASRPGLGERPTTLPGLGNRPGIGGDRPGIGDRPGLGDRPGYGEGGRFENRQDWLNNRQENRGDRRDNLQDRMDNRFENRDDIREDWQDWYGHNWDHHDGWHHGCWGGHYGDWWHHMWDDHPVAAAFGLTCWGVNRLNYWFGYYPYYNPYYYQPYPVSSTVAIDYSQPLVVYEQSADALAASGQAPPEAAQDPGLAAFDQARQAFLDGNYQAALDGVNTALASMPDDAVLHEFRALVLFAMGKYKDAAAGLHAVLAVGPGWDWTTMSGLYASIDTYTKQLRALEQARDQSPNAPELRLLLAYHYLTAGHTEAAAAQFKKLVEQQPKDQVARQLLEMTAGPEAVPGAPATPPAPEAEGEPAVTIPPADVVGKWNAKGADNTSFALTLTEKGEFTWAYTAGGKETKVSGVYALDGANLALEPDEGGVMLAQITPPKNGAFHFQVVGSPPDDKGLDFRK